MVPFEELEIMETFHICAWKDHKQVPGNSKTSTEMTLLHIFVDVLIDSEIYSPICKLNCSMHGL